MWAVRSFSIIHELAHKTETAVLEEYLERAWQDAATAVRSAAAAGAGGAGDGAGTSPSCHAMAPAAPGSGSAAALALLPAPPEGHGAIALMRLVAQAQVPASQLAVLSAFGELSADDKHVLADEMARTGLAGQTYRREPPHRDPDRGPALLVYYSPAFVRSLAAESHAPAALRLLAEVYRRARTLWPLVPIEPSGGRGCVTVRIDQIKGVGLGGIEEVYSMGDSWLIYKRNEQEAVVECHTIDYMAELVQQGTRCAVLKFYNRRNRRKQRKSTESPSRGGGASGGTTTGSVTPLSELDPAYTEANTTDQDARSPRGSAAAAAPAPTLQGYVQGFFSNGFGSKNGARALPALDV